MKYIVLFILLSGITALSGQDPFSVKTSVKVSGSGTAVSDTNYIIELSVLPSDYSQFDGVAAQLDDKPYGAAALVIIALNVFSKNETEGLRCLLRCLDDSYIKSSTRGLNYNGTTINSQYLSRIITQLERYPGIASAYFEGAAPENGYTPNQPYTVTMYLNKYSRIKPGKHLKYFVVTKAADSNRPIQVKLNKNGLWKGAEFSSIYTGIKPVE